MVLSLGYVSMFLPNLRFSFYYRIKVSSCIHPIFESLSHYEELDWLPVLFHVHLSLIYDVTYLCLHKRLTELVSFIHFLCD